MAALRRLVAVFELEYLTWHCVLGSTNIGHKSRGESFVDFLYFFLYDFGRAGFERAEVLFVRAIDLVYI